MENKRVTETQERFAMAMVTLLQFKSLDDVSVKNLCKEAGMSRQTFYRLYSKKEDVLVQYLDDIFNEYLTNCSVSESISDMYYYMSITLLNARPFFMLLFQADVDALILLCFQRMLDGLRKFFVAVPVNDYRETFFAGGAYLVLKRWILGGAKETPFEISFLLAEYSAPVLAEGFKKREPDSDHE